MRILVIDVPGLHLGYLGCYGNDWVGTPNIDRFASESAVFDRHFFDVVQPQPVSWTGHHPFYGAGFQSAEIDAGWKPAPLGKILAEHGLAHASISGSPGVSVRSLEEIVAKTLESCSEEHAVVAVRFPSLVPPWDLPEELLNSYCEEEDQPWPDPPWGPLENADDLPRLQNTYAAVVTYVDAHLGAIFDSLRESGQFDEALVCLTSSSGLPLGEHDVIGPCRPWPHEEFVHLPLLVRLPRAERAGVRLAALTQPVDLLPTFLEHLGIAPPPPTHGHGLWPLIRAEVSQVRPYACSGLSLDAAVEWALRTPEWALLLPVVCPPEEPARQPRLYVKPDDRWEVNDVAQHHQELVEELAKTLRDFAAKSLTLTPPQRGS